ncbi:MAG: FtsQ-type POTRA domain-containing protein [Ruminococcus sp.]
MDEQRPIRRRNLSPKEQKALEKQRKRQQEIDRKKAREEARYREEARKRARENGEDSHIVVTIPADIHERKTSHKSKSQKPKKKSIPDIISAETDKRVRNLSPTDHSDGYYVNEVKVRREQAEKQRTRRRKNQPKPISPKKRRTRRIIMSTVILVLVVIIGIILSFTVLFKTEKIIVKGNKYYKDDTIIQLSGVTEGENIFLASMSGNTEAIKNSLPYVKNAQINFQIPNTVVIDIEHEKPYYTLKSGSDLYLVNEEGRILEKVEKRNKKIMLVTAPKLKNVEIGGYVAFDSKRTTNALKAISESLINNNYKKTTAINVKKINSLTITYDNRIKIKLGFPDDIDYKIRTAFTIINEKLDPNNSGRVKGVLNVSECHTTKKSYFNEGYVKATEPTQATETTQPATDQFGGYVTYVTEAPVYYETEPTTYQTSYYTPEETEATTAVTWQ